MKNRFAAANVVPVLVYADVRKALNWRCDACGFRERVRAEQADGKITHAQLEFAGGHRWTFSQSIADVAPSQWGGVER